MGYCIKLVSKKKILESDVKSIIHNMPDYLRGPLNEAKEQEWGWPCICDVSKPIDQEITISGAYAMSGDKAQEFTDYFQRALDELGYDVDILYTDTVLFDEEVSKNVTPIDAIFAISTLIAENKELKEEIEELKAISEYRENIIKGLGLKTIPKTITEFKQLIENNDKKWEDKIKAKIEEVKDGTFDAKIVLQSLLGKE